MFLAAIVLIVSTALFFFFLQATCQQILRRSFDQEYFQPIVNANRLEFLAVRQSLDDSDLSADYARLLAQLKCDYLALTYLLKNAANLHRRYSRDERWLMVYFRATLVLLAMRHALKIGEKSAFLRLTAILEYFANVLGRRVTQIRSGSLAPSEYLMNL
jgi:hypothetical protein